MEDIYIMEVELFNFQSHKHTVLPFVKGTNALIGTSNSGKTSIIRGIRWCLLNTPSGTEYIRVGSEEAKVIVTLSNGKKIERHRGKKKSTNFYRLYEGDELVDEYTGFGSGVPDEVMEAHGIAPIANDIYFQFADQMEAPFMLSLKPRQRADVLGNLEELTRIDKALAETNDDIKSKKKEQKSLEKEEKALKLEFERLKVETNRLASKVDALKTLKDGIQTKSGLKKFVDQQLIRLKEIDTITKEIAEEVLRSKRIANQWPENLEERIATFKHLQARVIRLKEIKEELVTISFMKEEALSELEELKGKVEKQMQKFETLTLSARNLKRNKEMKDSLHGSYSDRVAALEFGNIDLDVSKYKVIFAHLERLKNINNTVEETEQMVKEATNQIDTLLDQFVTALHEAELCPTCGQNTEDVCTNHVELITN